MMQWRLLIAAPLVVSALGRTAAAANSTTSLKIGLVPKPEIMLSKSDLRAGGTSLPLSRQRLVVPKNSISLEKTLSHTLSLGGAEFTIRRRQRDFMLEVPGGRSAKLRKKGNSFLPMPVPLPEKRKYVLAFPYTHMASIGLRSGSIQKAKIGGKDFALYDDDMDGFYGTGDTFQIGRGSVFAPITKYFSTFSSVFELVEVDREGRDVTYTRYSGDTGKFSVKNMSRMALAQVVFTSKEADLSLILLGKGKQAKVIPGNYGLLYGLATDPSMKKVYAGIVPGSFAPVAVAKDDKAVAQMGGPYRLDFKHSIARGKVSLSPSTIKLFGENGERYVSFDFKGAPKVSITSGGRTVQSESMGFC